MAPLEWDKIMNADKGNLEEDADIFFQMIQDFNPTNESRIENLKKLFEVTKEIMILKNDQAEEVMTQMEEEAKKDFKNEGKLRAKIKELEIENKNLKKSGTDSEYSSSTRYMREENQDLTIRIQHLNEEYVELQRDLDKEKRASERYNTKIIELEKDKNMLQQDNDQMRQDISDYKMQLQSQRDNLMHQKEGDLEYKDKLAQKNRQLGEAMEELQNLTDANEELKKQCRVIENELTSKLTDAVKDIDQTTEDYLKLKKIVQVEDTVNDKLREENTFMKTQIVDLTERVQVKSDSDDAVMVAVGHKVEEWKKLILEKDQDIISYQDEILHLRKQLAAANLDADRASVAALTKVIEERDKQIYELTEEMKNLAEEMETNAAIIEDFKNELSKTGSGPGHHLQKKMREQQMNLLNKSQLLKDADNLVKQAENDALEKDKYLSEALERMRQYESGEYGLAEAVSEIKELKKQLMVRQRKIEELVQLVNKSEGDVNELTEENEVLREQLGMNPKKPMNMKEHHSKITTKREEQRALNIVLQKEVECLEEERISLKQNLRKLAQQTGQRAVALGLTADDMVSIQNYTEELKYKSVQKSTSHIPKKLTETDDLKIKHTELREDFKSNLQQLEELHNENGELRTQNKQLGEENSEFLIALKDINKNMKREDTCGSGKKTMECPALERVIAAIETKKILGNYDMSLYLKTQVDNLQGRNEELRTAFRDARHETNIAKLEAEKTTDKIKKLEQDITIYKQQGNQSGPFQSLVLPEGMPVSSSELIASLNEHLLVTLEELFLRQEQIEKTENHLEAYHSKFAVMRHQQGLLYADCIKEKQEHDTEISKLKEELKKMDDLKHRNEVHLQEFDRLLDTLSKDEVEVRRRLAEQTRKLTVLLVNEKALTRSYNTMMEVEASMRKEISKLKNESISMEKAVTERIGYLQRFKDTAMFKISALQKALEDSVSSYNLERANKEYQNLTEKYRDLLEKENLFVSKSEILSSLEEEMKRLTSENEHMKKILEMEKEKVHTLEASIENLLKKGMATSTDVLPDQDSQSLSKRMAMVEMKELHERQRAEHAVHMYEKSKSLMNDLEQRTKELEQNLSEVSQVNLALQKTEHELRDELANSVTKAISESDRKKIAELEQTEVTLKTEISKLKEVSDVATSQVFALEMQQISRDKEVLSLRQQLLDFQAQSDDKTVIGKLHRHIVQLQVSEGTAIQKLENEVRKGSKLEAQLLRLEQQIDVNNQTIYHNRTEAQNKIKHLKRNLFELRRQFAGAVPLAKQEKFAKNMIQMQEDKLKIEKELIEVNGQRRQVEDRLAELQLLQSSQKELMNTTLKGNRDKAKIVAEWHSKMEILRLSELRQKRQIIRLQEQINLCEKTNKHQETTVSELESNNVRLSKEFEEHQLAWEYREQELEYVISNMEKQASDIAGAAAQFGKNLGNLPDSSEPVAVQLESAIVTIKRNMKEISDSKAETKVLRKRVEELQAILREAETDLIAKDKLIAEIRLRMPATADRDIFIKKSAAAITKAMKKENSSDDNFETQQAIKVAHCAVSSLKARIQLKEESIKNLQELLKTAHEDMEKMSCKHFEELKSMQLKMQANTDRSYMKFKEAAQELANKPITDETCTNQMIRLEALEDLVAERDDAMSSLVIQIKSKDEEILALHMKLQQITEQKGRDKEESLKQHSSEISKRNSEYQKLLQKLKVQDKEMQILKEEMSVVKEANSRAPSTNMKRLVEQLRNQLSLKENQNQALSKALSQVRADIVEQAEQTIKLHQAEKIQGVNIQKLLDKQTQELSEQIENLQVHNERLKTDLKKKREKENNLESDLDDVRDELEKKNSLLQKLKHEKQQQLLKAGELERKNDRLKTASQKSNDTEGQELNEMRRRVRFLEDEVKRRQQQAEKPYEQVKTEKPKNVELIKWEEKKKWEKTVEKMKARIKECELENEKLQKETKRLKMALDRSNREKDGYESKVKTISKTHAAVTDPSSLAVPELKHTYQLEQLKELNFQQSEEISRLKRKLTKNQDQTVKEVAEENKHLLEQIEGFKKALNSRFLEGKDSNNCKEYQALFERNQELQKQLLQLSKENIEIHFEMEEAKKDAPRLKTRVEDLQTYVEALKAENKRLCGDKSDVKKVGESGKSPKELEKIIALLKKVVDRVQAENEQLKNSATTATASGREETLKQENLSLVQKVKDLEKRLELSSTDKHLTKEKGTAKLMTDYEKLRKDFLKETDLKMKFQSQVEKLMDDNETLKNKLDEANMKLNKEENMRSSGVQSIESKLTNKLRKLEEELENKLKMMVDMKVLLRESAEREQYLMQEKQGLLRQISLLETCPVESVGTDAELRHNYQQARLMINQLETEKKELLKELKLLQQKIHGEVSKSTEDMLLKARAYDSLVSNNVELQLQLKRIKLDKDKLLSEVLQLRNELKNFGPEFFEEIEDLKYNYKEAMKRNVFYEDQLKHQFKQS